MNLVIDVGNSRIKYAFFEGKNLSLKDSIVPDDFQKLLNHCEDRIIDTIFIMASGDLKSEWIELLRHKGNVVLWSDETKLPISILYESPQTLGKDRIAGAVAAWTLFPNQTSLIIDMGTCITSNIINKEGQYLGGTISPGLSMRAKSMHQFTDKLPLVELTLPKQFIGRNTLESMQNGVLRGTYYEIQSLIDNISPIFGVNNVILTGGDAKTFENLLNFEIFALPNLVLLGIHEILQYNE
ncbi:MAG: type III pantothenate kinase [Saprospiraceae bacterium]